LEQNHRHVKRITRATLGFASLEITHRTVAGIEAMHSYIKIKHEKTFQRDSCASIFLKNYLQIKLNLSRTNAQEISAFWQLKNFALEAPRLPFVFFFAFLQVSF